MRDCWNDNFTCQEKDKMGFVFSWKNKSGRWENPEPCNSAADGREKAYKKSGKRGRWITADDDHAADLEKYISAENEKKKISP